MMKNNNYIEAIEKLNKQIIELECSKEYTLGKKIIDLKSSCNVFSKVKTYVKTKKYNHNEPCENFYHEINKIDLRDKKIVIYTALIGNYDYVKEPLIVSDNCDYILFTDQNIVSSAWNIKPIPNEILKLKNPVLINRFFKMNPSYIFKDYDYAIYVDASINVISELNDLIYRLNPKYGIAFHQHRYRSCIYEEVKVCHLLKKGAFNALENQKKRYLREKFPYNYGMLECGVIVFDLHNDVGKEILEEWWNEFVNSKSMRDQISLPYVLWKNKIDPKDIATLGNNMYKNEKIRIDRVHRK